MEYNTLKGDQKCFNCNGPHHLSLYTDPQDAAHIKKNCDTNNDAWRLTWPPMDPKWQALKPSQNNKRFIDGHPYTCNTVTNQWDKDDDSETGPSGNLAAATCSTTPQPQQPAWVPPGQPSWTPTLPAVNSTASQSPSPAAAQGGAFLAGIHGDIGQQYSTLGLQEQPLPSQLAAFIADTAANVITTNEDLKAGIFRQMNALQLEHQSLK